MQAQDRLISSGLVSINVGVHRPQGAPHLLSGGPDSRSPREREKCGCCSPGLTRSPPIASLKLGAPGAAPVGFREPWASLVVSALDALLGGGAAVAPDHRRAWGVNEGASQMCAAQQLEISFCNEEREVVTEPNVGVHMCVLHAGVCCVCGCVLCVCCVWWACARVCIWGVFACMRLCVHMCVCTCVCACKYVCAYLCAYLCFHVCACACACVDTCVSVCVCVCMQRLGGAASGKRRSASSAFHFGNFRNGLLPCAFLSFLCRQASQMGLNEEENESARQH